ATGRIGFSRRGVQEFVEPTVRLRPGRISRLEKVRRGLLRRRSGLQLRKLRRGGHGLGVGLRKMAVRRRSEMAAARLVSGSPSLAKLSNSGAVSVSFMKTMNLTTWSSVICLIMAAAPSGVMLP